MCLTAEDIKELQVEIRRLITKFKRTVVTTKQGDTVETIKLTFVSKEKAIDMINRHIEFVTSPNTRTGFKYTFFSTKPFEALEDIYKKSRTSSLPQLLTADKASHKQSLRFSVHFKP